MRGAAAKLIKPAAVLGAIFFSLNPLLAQRARFGANAGFSLAFFTGPEDLIDRKNQQLAYRAGVSISFDLSRKVSIASGLEYWNRSFEGSLRSYGMLTVITPVHLRVQHLALPLMLRYRLGSSVFFGAGGYFAPKVGGRLTLLREENDRLEAREFGYAVGIGTVFRIFKREQVLELQWRQGLTPVFSINDDKFFFSTLSLLYGIRF